MINKNQESVFKSYLYSFAEYLSKNSFKSEINLDLFLNDLNNNWDIQSNIPIGYGLGSSGVVVASVYDKYAIDKSRDMNINELKSFLGSMENYFHGTSSGLDPLVCYLNKMVEVRDGKIIIHESIPEFENLKLNLIDTNQNRSTKKLVEVFNQIKKSKQFNDVVLPIYVELTSACIDSYLKRKEEQLFKLLKQLSLFQFQNFDFAIPESFRKRWQKSLKSKTEVLKLCGAGGGGFMIEFSMEVVIKA
jgi:mevalonate kinase